MTSEREREKRERQREEKRRGGEGKGEVLTPQGLRKGPTQDPTGPGHCEVPRTQFGTQWLLSPNLQDFSSFRPAAGSIFICPRAIA